MAALQAKVMPSLEVLVVKPVGAVGAVLAVRVSEPASQDHSFRSSIAAALLGIVGVLGFRSLASRD